MSGRLGRNSLKDWNSLLAIADRPLCRFHRIDVARSLVPPRAAEFPLGLRRALRSFQVDAADLLAALCDGWKRQHG